MCQDLLKMGDGYCYVGLTEKQFTPKDLFLAQRPIAYFVKKTAAFV